MPAFDRDGHAVGTVNHVHREAPEGTMAPGTGYLEIDGDRPERKIHLHIPLTQVLNVGPDRVVVDTTGHRII